MNTKNILLILVAVLILGGLFFILKPKSGSNTYESPLPSSAETQKVASQTFVLSIKNKKIDSGETVLMANEGDEVTFKVTSDEPGEMHIHGYDKSLELKKDQEVTTSFVADITGKFPFELEESGIELGSLEVQPK